MEPSTFRFSAGRSFTAPPLDTVDFPPEGPSSQSSTQSRANKARAGTVKAKEARAMNIAERKANSNDISNKSARMTDLAETASQERIESELSSELDEVNMRDLERQLDTHRRDQVYQPSSPLESTPSAREEEGEEEEESRKRKQPHSEDLSLNIRLAGRRRMYSRKSSHAGRQ